MLIVDPRARTISGRAVPWGEVARVARTIIAFDQGCLIWSEPVPLCLRHDRSLHVGKSTQLESRDDGLYVTFRVFRDDRGDRALAKVADGWQFSVGVDEVQEELRGDTYWCTRGKLHEISLVPDPGYPQ